MVDIRYIISTEELTISIPMSSIKAIAESGAAAAEARRYNGGQLKVTSGAELASTMTRVMDQYELTETGVDGATALEQFLDQTIYRAVDWGTDGITVVGGAPY